MIPISQDDKIIYKDESSEVRYLIRPVTGANELMYLSIVEKYKKGMSRAEEWAVMDELTNFLLVGWEGCGVPFPSDGNPSRYLNSAIKNKIIEQAQGLEAIEAKN